MAAGSIIVDLLMRTGSFGTDTARAAQSLKKLQKEAAAVGKALGVAATGAAVGLAALVKSTIDSNDHLNDLSQKAGVAADTLGGIGFAASQAGLDLDSVAAGVGKLNKSLAEAASGNKQALEAFNALGVSVKDAAGNTKTADAALAELADKFASYADGPEKAAHALRLFGKAGADMIPLLNGGGQALLEQIAYFKRYSGVTVESAKAADDFNDTLGKIKLLGGAFAQTLTAELLPALQTLADLWLKNKESGDQFKGAASGIADTVKALALVVAYGAEQFVLFGKAIGAVGAAGSALASGSLSEARAAFRALLEDAAAARSRLDSLGVAFDARSAGAGGGRGFVNPAVAVPNRPAAPRLPGGGGGGKSHAERMSEAERYLQSLQKQLEKTQELSAVEQLLADISHKRLTGLTRPLAGKALDLAQQIDAAKALKEEEKARAEISEILFENSQRLGIAASGEAKALEESNAQYRAHTEELGLSNEALFALERARISSSIAIKEEALATEQAKGFCNELTDALERQVAALREQQELLGHRQSRERYVDDLKKIGDESRALRDSVALPFEEAFASVLDGSKSAKDAFDAFTQSVVANMAKIAAQKLAFQLFGDGKGQGGVDWASLFAQVVGAFGGGKATGGPVDSGKAYMVGERGPELFVPKSAGNIVANGQLKGGKVVNNHININMPQGATRETGNQFGAAVAQRLAVADRRNN